MKPLIFLAIFFCATFSFGSEKVAIYKNWKIFRSNYGYEFKYPDCWDLRGDSPDEPHNPNERSKDIAVSEGSCKRSQMAAWVPNGIGISGGWNPFKSPEESVQKLNKIEKNAGNAVVRGAWKVYKRISMEGGSELEWVEVIQGVGFYQIRWNMDLYCLTQKISFVGPTIKNPDKLYLEKFKSGDLALPEPEKAIYGSIKCIEPKSTKNSEPK